MQRCASKGKFNYLPLLGWTIIQMPFLGLHIYFFLPLLRRDGSRARRARVVTTHTRAREVIHVRRHTSYYMTGKEHYPCPLPAGAMCPWAYPFTRYKLTIQHFIHKSPQAERHYHNLKKGYSCTKFNNISITSSSILDGGIYTNLTKGPHVSWFLRVNGRSGHG